MRATLAILLLLPCSVSAELVINITGGTRQARPVAVVPFGPLGAGGPDVAQIIADDLAYSGRFAPMARSDMIDQPTRADEVDYQDWRLLGVEALVVGARQREGDRWWIRFQVLDVYRGAQLMGLRVPVQGNDWRTAGHQIADLVYRTLTGEPGAFNTRIAYVTATGPLDDRRYALEVADWDGENNVAVFRSAWPIMSPAWSHDGEYLAYVSFQDDHAQIVVHHWKSGQRQVVSREPGINGAPTFSPDGRHLAVALSRGGTNLDVYVIQLASGGLTRLTTNAAADTEPVFSPDGEQVYFTSDRGGGPQIYRVPVSGGRPERVTFEGRYNARPRLSPDGRYLTTVHQVDGRYRIAAMDLRNGALRVLTDGDLDESPSFAPNGSIIIYATMDGDSGVLRSTTLDGYGLNFAGAPGVDVREPVWGPYGSKWQLTLPGED